jgi:predicted MFS family arabinose efflux permease
MMMATVVVREQPGDALPGASAGFPSSLLVLCLAMLAAMSSFYLLLSTVPVHAAAVGGDVWAGFATGALMATTIAGELAAALLVARLGRRGAMALGLVLLSLPCLFSFAGDIATVLIATAVRGLGLGIVLVVACGLATCLAPVARRAEALGLYGLSSTAPAIIAVPLGPWVLAHSGASVTAWTATLLGLFALAGLGACSSRDEAPFEAGTPVRLPLRSIAWPGISLAAGAIIVGASVTFLPLAHPEIGAATIMGALLAQGLASAFTRWIGGRAIDRNGPRGTLITGIFLTVIASLCLAADGSVAVLIGMAASGAGFGAVQGSSLAYMLDRTDPAQVDTISAAWNIAYDTGLGLGGLVFGLMAAGIGYGPAFAVAGAAIGIGVWAVAALCERPSKWAEAGEARC